MLKWQYCQGFCWFSFCSVPPFLQEMNMTSENATGSVQAEQDPSTKVCTKRYETKPMNHMKPYSVCKAGWSAAYDSNGLTFWCWVPSDVSVDEIISMKVDILRAVSLKTRSVTRIIDLAISHLTLGFWMHADNCHRVTVDSEVFNISWRCSCPWASDGSHERGSSLPFLILGALACLGLTVHSLCNCTVGFVHSILRLIYCHKTFGVISSRNGKRMPYLWRFTGTEIQSSSKLQSRLRRKCWREWILWPRSTSKEGWEKWTWRVYRCRTACAMKESVIVETLWQASHCMR